MHRGNTLGFGVNEARRGCVDEGGAGVSEPDLPNIILHESYHQSFPVHLCIAEYDVFGGLGQSLADGRESRVRPRSDDTKSRGRCGICQQEPVVRVCQWGFLWLSMTSLVGSASLGMLDS